MTTTAAWMLSAPMLTFAASPALAQEEPASEEPASEESESEEEEEERWQGEAGLAVLLTSGNTETQSLGLDFNLVRQPEPWGFEVNAHLQRAEDSGVRTAERYELSLRGKRYLADKWDLFVGVVGEQDEFAGLDLRTLVEAGVEYQALTGPKHHLAFDLGVSYTDEDRVEGEPDTDSVGAIAGLTYEWHFTKTASIAQRLIYYPNFDNSDDWRVDSDTALTASISSRMALQLSYERRFRNQPIGDRDDTDATTNASLVLNF